MSLEMITVPNLSAAELCGLAQQKLVLTSLGLDPSEWDFVADEGGKTYEVMVMTRGRCVTTDEARKLFPKDFTGNTAAFVAWVTEKNPRGWHVSIPEDDRLLPDGDHLFAPYFYRNSAYRKLDLTYVSHRWGGGYYSFVAFRELK